MSSSSGAQADKRRGAQHAPRQSSAPRGRSASGSRGALIAPPPKALHAGPGSSSPPSAGAEDPEGPSPKEGGPGAGTASSALLKEKDERIAALERELGVMEGEFARELDRLSRNESETATFWQGKHSALNQRFLRADTELRLLRAEVEVRRGEREELREGWDVLRREVREGEEVIAGLRGQVRGLKEWVSTSTRSDAQVADEVFGEGMARLGNELQNWVIVHFRRAKLGVFWSFPNYGSSRANAVVDFGKAEPEVLEELARLVPMYEELADVAKVHLLQSIVSGILVEMVFGAYFVGLPQEQTDRLKEVEQFLRSICKAIPACASARSTPANTTQAGSDEPINHWRSTTLSILHRAADPLAPETTALIASTSSRITALLTSITDARPSDPSRDAPLNTLISSSVDLARRLAVQRAEFRVWMPELAAHQRAVFEARSMEDIGGEEYDAEEGLDEREIWCVAFPGVIKRGDESGGQLQFENVVAKARVLCRPE